MAEKSSFSNSPNEPELLPTLYWLRKGAAVARLINRLFSTQIIPFAIEFTFGRGSSRTLLTGPWRGFGHLLPFPGETWFGCDTRATGAFSTSLATVRLALMRIPFPGPLVLHHSTARTGRHWVR
jgi:hypothetical protein